MFKYRRIKKAHKNFQREAERYMAFLDSMVELGYGKYTDADLVNAGREDLVAEEKRLKDRMLKENDNLSRAYGL